MSLPGPTPLQSFLGGVCLAFPVQALLSFNDNTFGISGFMHGAARGRLEDAMSVLGLVLGGVAVAVIEGDKPTVGDTAPLPLMLSGLLVGAGAKVPTVARPGRYNLGFFFGLMTTNGDFLSPPPLFLARGRHMICGLSHFSSRSIAATATFCATASLTARLFHGMLPPIPGDPSLGAHGGAFLASGVVALVSTLAASRVISAARFGFAFALRLSNLSDSRRVLAFLLTPAHTAFDSSLVYLAVGAIPLTTLLYRIGTVRVPKKGKVDARLLTGAALFGVGWGIEGICPGPGLINFGWALATGANVKPLATWLTAVIIGGFVVPS
ncbi:hypothetical protein EDB89DRAFT_1958676 [Lactarius sanguifluus]|nr:hypothetical protein EDB89DRAFT_1958676 [Lactarius sanguifluus]